MIVRAGIPITQFYYLTIPEVCELKGRGSIEPYYKGNADNKKINNKNKSITLTVTTDGGANG